MNGTWSIQGLCDVAYPMVDVAQVASLLAKATREDLAQLEAFVARGQREAAAEKAHRMRGALSLFERVPAFAHIRDIIEAMEPGGLDRLIARLPEYRARLLDFVGRLELEARRQAGS